MAESRQPTPAELAAVEPEELDSGPAADPTGEALDRRLFLRGRGLREHTARGAIVNGLFQIGLAGISLIRNVAVAAFLTASEFGLWGLIVTTLITLAWLKQIGIADKFVQQDEEDQVAEFQKAFTLELAYTGLFYVLVFVALPLYGVIYGRPEIIVPGIVLSLALLGSALQTPLWIAYRQMRFVRQRTLESIDPVVSTIVMIAMAVAGYGYWSLIVGVLAGSFCGALAAVLTCPYPIRLRYDRGTLRRYFSFGWPLLVSSAAGLVVVQGAVIIGNYTVGLAGVGAIGLAGIVARFSDRVDQIVSLTIYPAVCAVKDRTALLFEAFVKSNRLALMWGLPFGVGLALFATDLVDHVLGPTWIEAEPLLVAFGLILGFGQVAFNWTLFMNAIGRTKPMAIEGGFIVAVFAVVTAPAMILWGLDGYIVGMVATLLVQLALRGYFLGKLFEGFRILPHLVRAMAPSVPAVAAVLAVRALDGGGERSLEQSLSQLGLYVVVTAIATLAFERRLLREIAGYLGRRRSLPRGTGEGALTG
jgi:O-antigen/teichoic acid export membrane protein